MNNQEQSTGSPGNGSAGGAAESGGGGPVPYDRFAAVIAERNTLRAQYAELEAGHKKAVETLGGLQKSLEAERVGGLRLRAAIAAGLPIELADRLAGGDAATIGEDAARLAALLSARSAAAAPGVPPGVGGSGAALDVKQMSAAEIRKHTGELLKQSQR